MDAGRVTGWKIALLKALPYAMVGARAVDWRCECGLLL